MPTASAASGSHDTRADAAALKQRPEPSFGRTENIMSLHMANALLYLEEKALQLVYSRWHSVSHTVRMPPEYH